YLVNVVPSGEVIDSTLLPPNLLNNGTTEQSDVTEVSEAHLSLDDAGGNSVLSITSPEGTTLTRYSIKLLNS
ncbi:hypothetical protein ACUOCP_58025, partial [Escherichia sp. R-CC3]